MYGPAQTFPPWDPQYSPLEWDLQGLGTIVDVETQRAMVECTKEQQKSKS